MHGDGSFHRWQTIAISQLGYAVGLVLSLATATLGFAATVIRDPAYSPSCWGKISMLAAFGSLVLSISSGLLCTINRLCDFRKTRSIARDREDWEEQGTAKDDIDRRLKTRRDETRRLGERSWVLFCCQAATFVLGFGALILALGILYHARLF